MTQNTGKNVENKKDDDVVYLRNGNPQFKLTKKEQALGGRMKGVNTRRRKALAELIDAFGSLDVKDEDIKKMMKGYGIDEKNFSNDMAIVVSQFRQALRGSTKAFNSLRDTRGQTPDKNINVRGDITPVGLSDLTASGGDKKKK